MGLVPAELFRAIARVEQAEAVRTDESDELRATSTWMPSKRHVSPESPFFLLREHFEAAADLKCVDVVRPAAVGSPERVWLRLFRTWVLTGGHQHG